MTNVACGVDVCTRLYFIQNASYEGYPKQSGLRTKNERGFEWIGYVMSSY